jgi:hypothetical protein
MSAGSCSAWNTIWDEARQDGVELEFHIKASKTAEKALEPRIDANGREGPSPTQALHASSQ